MIGVLGAGALRTPWFEALTVFVAVNTIVYLGLALTKLIPRRKKSRVS
ncbi:MAG TPA: hypothetical protein VNF47_24640 [Streptosporangiaceae bacterium]|nr:hypothetical protein [Streptosporangiaceae bacterium]